MVAEPDKELFVVPADYKQADITYVECSLGKNNDCPS
jgi:hypothetical protein